MPPRLHWEAPLWHWLQRLWPQTRYRTTSNGPVAVGFDFHDWWPLIDRMGWCPATVMDVLRDFETAYFDPNIEGAADGEE